MIAKGQATSSNFGFFAKSYPQLEWTGALAERYFSDGQVHEYTDAPYALGLLRHGCGYALANAGHDTRALQAWLGHKNIQHTVRYTELAPDRFRDFSFAFCCLFSSSTRRRCHCSWHTGC
jgi:hypothetical protein